MADLTLELADIPSTVTRGEFVVPTVRVCNSGSQPITVSSRLNLFEGDLTVWRVGPGGDRTPLRGVFLVDSLLRQAELAPGQRLEAGLFLSYTSLEDPFRTTGVYRLEAEYTPSVKRPAITSEPVQLQVVEATTDELREIAAVTTDEVKRAVALTGFDTPGPPVHERLQMLADKYPRRAEGTIAGLALYQFADTGQRDETVLESSVSTHDPPTIARWISAIVGTSGTETPLVAAFLDELDNTSDSESAEFARRIVREEPISG